MIKQIAISPPESALRDNTAFIDIHPQQYDIILSLIYSHLVFLAPWQVRAQFLLQITELASLSHLNLALWHKPLHHFFWVTHFALLSFLIFSLKVFDLNRLEFWLAIDINIIHSVVGPEFGPRLEQVLSPFLHVQILFISWEFSIQLLFQLLLFLSEFGLALLSKLI